MAANPLFPQRRRLLQGAGAVASLASAGALAALPSARPAAVDLASAFAAKTFEGAVAALGGIPVPSARIALEVPAVADNGAVVPLAVTSTLPGTREILILVDGNPQPMAAWFSIPSGTEAFIATRIRMAGNGTVYAAVRTDDGFFATARAIEVTVGGCG